MCLMDSELLLRGAGEEDVKVLNAWWNDGAVMAHAGFPDGLNQPLEETLRLVRAYAASADHGLWIILHRGTPIGESSWQLVDSATARCGWKICEADYQNRGLGPRVIRMTLSWLFSDEGLRARHPITSVIWDTNLNNTRAQLVYEHKIGAERLGVRENSWQDQRGVWQSAVDYRVTRGRFMGDT